MRERRHEEDHQRQQEKGRQEVSGKRMFETGAEYRARLAAEAINAPTESVDTTGASYDYDPAQVSSTTAAPKPKAKKPAPRKGKK